MNVHHCSCLRYRVPKITSLLRSFTFSSVACLAVPYFSTLSYERQDIRDIFTEHRRSFDFLYNFSDILSQMYIGLHVKYPLFLSVLINVNFLNGFSSNPQISNFVKILPVGPSCSTRTDGRTDGQTDRHRHTHTDDEANSRFSKFCERG